MSLPAEPLPVQGARPDEGAAALIRRGCLRLMATHDFFGVAEFTLSNQRRADLALLGRDGELWIIEIKSCLNDFRTDVKWQDYLPFCDRFFFAVNEAFPRDVLPEQCGLILADAWGGAILREAPLSPLAPARRKAMTLQLARVAALRLARSHDPDFNPLMS